MPDNAPGSPQAPSRRRRARAADGVVDAPVRLDPGPSAAPLFGSRRAARLAAQAAAAASGGSIMPTGSPVTPSVPLPSLPADVSASAPAAQAVPPPGGGPSTSTVILPSVGAATMRIKRRTIALPEAFDEVADVATMPVRTVRPGLPGPGQPSAPVGRGGVTVTAPGAPGTDEVRLISMPGMTSTGATPEPPTGAPAGPLTSAADALAAPGRRGGRRSRRGGATGEAEPLPPLAPPGTVPPEAEVAAQAATAVPTSVSPSAAKPAAPASGGGGRAGRNLPMAILVGATLGGLVLASLLVRKEAWVGLVGIAIVLSVWELARAFSAKEIAIPVVPLAVGSLGMLVSAFVAGEDGLLVSFGLTVFGAMLWRLIDGFEGAARDVTAAVFTAAYVPFLAGFTVLMVTPVDGAQRVITFVLVTVSSDIGGYTAGVLFGKHPMAPTVSPKKTWEGFAGSFTTCVTVGVLSVIFLLDGPWWAGIAVGAAAVVTATMGDLCESLLKRDLGIKDMGHLLPGHGGMLDRIDSLLLTAPVAYVLLSLLV